MNGVSGHEESDSSEFVEVDPTGRYGRYNEVLGKGASKIVYRAFDEYQGIEVAWNQVKLYDYLQSPEELERLYREIHLLKTLNHRNIMKFYTSWVDTDSRNINFVTEMFTSGTLRQYRQKHRNVNIRAVKHWCRQILSGLLYLHSRSPPVIHRDLKCDNIFVNGNQGEVKIGDLGLAAILRKSHAARCVGTPEFMAPEVYDEEYNELVDIYSFGMCILEMVTFDYPYSECTHPAQIYKKVISGKKPEALYQVENPEVRQFIEKCLATVSSRLSAGELLNDPFLQIDDYDSYLGPIQYTSDFNELGSLVRQPCYGIDYSCSSSKNGYGGYIGYDIENGLDYYLSEFQTSEFGMYACQEKEQLADFDISIKGKRREDDGIFLRLRIADKEGRIRNIYFPFDLDTDTALSVATEMVSELDMTDQDVTKIAEIIDAELASLVPEWKRGLAMQESPSCSSFCHNCASNGCLSEYVSSDRTGGKKLQVLPCSKHGCAAVHGRFEEITYQVDGTEQCAKEGADLAASPQPDDIPYVDVWAQREGTKLSSPGSRDIHCDEVRKTLDQSINGAEERIIPMDSQNKCHARNRLSMNSAMDCGFLDDYENEIRQELRWLKAKYQMQLRELRDQQLGVKSKSSSLTLSFDGKRRVIEDKVSPSSVLPKPEAKRSLQRSIASCPRNHLPSPLSVDGEKKYYNFATQKVQNYEQVDWPFSPDQLVTARSYYTPLHPQSLHRATSLPVDSVGVSSK